MKRWEYKQIHENGVIKIEDQLAEAGREGWEAYAVTQVGSIGVIHIWLKREIIKKNPDMVR